jgi:hypothetical protein
MGLTASVVSVVSEIMAGGLVFLMEALKCGLVGSEGGTGRLLQMAAGRPLVSSSPKARARARARLGESVGPAISVAAGPQSAALALPTAPPHSTQLSKHPTHHLGNASLFSRTASSGLSLSPSSLPTSPS